MLDQNNDYDRRKTPPDEGGLGKLAKSVDKRRERYALQRVAAGILGMERVGKCRWSVADNSSHVRVLKRDDRARFNGLQTCGSVWMCPVCSANVSEVRRRELNDALASARQKGLEVLLLTLTFSHHDGDDLTALLDGLKEAKRHWHDSRTYRGFKHNVVGTVTATEVTHGRNGWHPHLHVLMFLKPNEAADGVLWLSSLSQQWVDSLAFVGLHGERSVAFQCQAGNAAGQYVAKWGAAEELTLGASKTGAGLHPWELLKRATHDPRARHLFFTYALAFKGRRQLLWSRGLKEALGVEVVDDEDAAELAANNEDEWITSFSREDWEEVRTFGRAKVLEACEQVEPTAALDALFSAPAVGDEDDAPLLE